MPRRISESHERVMEILARYNTTIVEKGKGVAFQALVSKPEKRIRMYTVQRMEALGYIRRNNAGEWELTDKGRANAMSSV